MRNRSVIMGLMGMMWASAVLGVDWNRFRGPNGSGIAEDANTPAAFTEKDYNWKIALPGIGHSSPVIMGKKIFVTCAEVESARRFLFCLDLDSGKTIWKKEYESRPFKQHRDNSYASASPTADAKNVYFTFITPDSYKVYCLDHDGKEQWTFDMGRWESQHGAGSSPILFEDTLIVPNDQDGPTSSLVGLDIKTGSQKWKLDRKAGKAAASTPCIFRGKDGSAQVISTSSGSGITAVDPRTGKIVWAIADAMPHRAVGSPIATDSLVIGSCGEGSNNRACVVVDPSVPNAKVVYKLPTGRDYPYVPCPLVKGGLMFTWSDVGTVTCIKVENGEKVWQEKLKASEGRTEFYSSPIIAGDKLYNITKDGVVICLRAGEKFEELGKSTLGDRSFATAAVAGNRLIIRTAGSLVSVGK